MSRGLHNLQSHGHTPPDQRIWGGCNSQEKHIRLWEPQKNMAAEGGSGLYQNLYGFTYRKYQ